jgi:cytidylate kinase
MARPVVCISRLLGAGGREVGRLVAERLGYVHVDEEIVQQAAAGQGLAVDQLADVERRSTFMDKLLESVTLAGGAEGYMMGAIGTLPPPPTTSDRDSLRELIRRSIEETADRGAVVIVAHAASYALRGRDDVLRVLVTASDETRRRRASSEGSLDEKQAAKAVRNDDAGRAAYLKQFYGVDREAPTHYDLTLNTDRVALEVAAGIIVQAATSD